MRVRRVWLDWGGWPDDKEMEVREIGRGDLGWMRRWGFEIRDR